MHFISIWKYYISSIFELTDGNRVQIVRYRFMDSDNYHILQHVQVSNVHPN